MNDDEWIDETGDDDDSTGFLSPRVMFAAVGALSVVIGSFVLGRCSVSPATSTLTLTTDASTTSQAPMTSTFAPSTSSFAPSTTLLETQSSESPLAESIESTPETNLFTVPEGTATRMLNRVNEERGREGLDPLAWCPALARAAKNHSVDMARRQYFEHETPEGLEVWDRAESEGYGNQYVGENIAVGQRSVTEVMDGWMDSPGHRENLLLPGYEHFGLGTATGRYDGASAIYWTQNFGSGGDCR